jgi:hypothetical protein
MYKDQLTIGDTCGVFVDGKIQKAMLIKRVNGVKSVVRIMGKNQEITVSTKKLRRIKTGV